MTNILDACFMMDDLRRRDSECMVRHAVQRRDVIAQQRVMVGEAMDCEMGLTLRPFKIF